jgi:DNA-binding response OmpR family regulator
MRRRALVIDDDREMRELIAAILDTAGFDADLLSDGIAALELQQEYDAIIVDLNMPVFDGEQLLEYWSITQNDLLRRVIVLTGYSHYTRGRKLPRIFATLSKPFDYEELMELVQQCSQPHLPSTTSCT